MDPIGWRLGLVLVVAATCATSCGVTWARAPRASSDDVPPAVHRNQVVLTPKRSRELVAWARRFQTCIGGRGLQSSMKVTRTQFTLLVKGRRPKSSLLRIGESCGDTLGGPPHGASLQVFGRTFVLYVPKQCLLDPNVAAAAG
jgi:hypothetical protein